MNITINEANKDLIKQAIKNQKWDRSSYEYALNSTLPYRYFDIYKKPELIELFYKTIETKFKFIAGYTTFRNIQFS